jgi:hypothetical protein
VISAVRPGSAELAALPAEIGARAVERGGGGATVRELFEISGASATKREHDLDRHSRNARAIGDVGINGADLPPSWFF